MFGLAVHRGNVRDINRNRLVAQVLQRHVGQIEMNPFHQHVGRQQHHLIACIDNGGIIADAFQGGAVLEREAGGNPVDQAKFAEGGNISAGRITHGLM